MKATKAVLLTTSIASLMASSLTFATPSEAPDVFIKRISDQLIVQLKANKSNLNNAKAINAIVKTHIEPYVDEVAISRLVMGTYYSKSTPQQKVQFTQNFRDSIMKTYATGLAQYSNEGYTLRPYRKSTAQYPVVMMDFKTSNGSKVPVAFQLADKGTQWKIRSLSVNGINLALTFRDQFKSSVDKNAGNLDKAIASFKPIADAQ